MSLLWITGEFLLNYIFGYLHSSLNICFHLLIFAIIFEYLYSSLDICTLLWIFVLTSGYLHSGPTGAGKSTIAAHLRDQHQVTFHRHNYDCIWSIYKCYSYMSWNTYVLYFQWVFYEGDCYLYGLDPFSGPLKKWAENCEMLRLLEREIAHFTNCKRNSGSLSSLLWGKRECKLGLLLTYLLSRSWSWHLILILILMLILILS